MAAVDGRSLLAYILSRRGCTHPFIASRVALLAELRYMEARGARLSDLEYVGGPGTFYIEGLKELIEGDRCFEKVEGDPATGRRGCIRYTCEPPSLPPEAAEAVEAALREAARLGEMELHRLVLEHPLYPRVVRGGV
ncbi:MAG: hypothetical protein LRS49_05855 [Desulfurococcales archaeon]|nr:hypothetical protein [Desulfurococcales archaeon]